MRASRTSGAFEVTARAFAGEPVDFAMRDPASGRAVRDRDVAVLWAEDLVTPNDLCGRMGPRPQGVALPEGGEAALERIWVIVARRGTARCRPAATLACCSRAATGGDLGAQRGAVGAPVRRGLAARRWRPVPALDRPVAGRARPARRRGVGRRRVADRGPRANVAARETAGIVPRYLPEERPRGHDRVCASTTWSARRARPSGCSSSSTVAFTARMTPARPGARSASGLPSDFGFPLAVDPSDPDSAYVIPLTGRHRPGDARRPRARIRDSRRRGTWAPRGNGLPARDAYLTVLRRAFDRAGEGSALQLYFGATSGDVFGSGDAGASWSTAATQLPPVFSVTTTA